MNYLVKPYFDQLEEVVFNFDKSKLSLHDLLAGAGHGNLNDLVSLADKITTIQHLVQLMKANDK